MTPAQCITIAILVATAVASTYESTTKMKKKHKRWWKFPSDLSKEQEK